MAFLRVRFGVQEDVQVVEGRLQADFVGVKHAVAEHVSAHVADAGDRELVVFHIDAEFPEVAGDRLPGAAGRDAHAFVVVAVGAAGGEGVTGPGLVLGGGGGCQVGQGGGALVGRRDEVRGGSVAGGDGGGRGGGHGL